MSVLKQDNHALSRLDDIINNIDSLPWTHALYLPGDGPWNEESIGLVLNPDDSDDPDEEPDEAKVFGLKYRLNIRDVQDVILNAKAQVPDVNMQGLVKALNFYYANDAFIQFGESNKKQS